MKEVFKCLKMFLWIHFNWHFFCCLGTFWVPLFITLVFSIFGLTYFNKVWQKFSIICGDLSGSASTQLMNASYFKKKKINTIYFLHPARIFLNSWNREIDQFSLFILMSMIFSVVVDVVDVVEECVRGELADNEKFKKISKWMVRPNILSKNRITSITRTTKYIFNMVHINSHHW